MSFTGKATYTQLYPSRPLGDASACADQTVYVTGSVFLGLDTEDGKDRELFLLARVAKTKFILICLMDGNRYSNRLIPASLTGRCTEFDFVSHVGSKFLFIGRIKDVLDVSNQAHRIIEEIKGDA